MVSGWPQPMNPSRKDALVKLENELRVNLSLDAILPLLEKTEDGRGGFMIRAERMSVEAERGNFDRAGKIIEILRKKDNRAFDRFCEILCESGNEVWGKKLRDTAEVTAKSRVDESRSRATATPVHLPPESASFTPHQPPSSILNPTKDLKNKPDPNPEKNNDESSCNQLQSSESTVRSSPPLSKECTDKNETQDSSSPEGPQMKHLYCILESTSCTTQTFEVGYRHIRKEGMTNTKLSKELWELVRVNPQADPLLKCVYFCLGMTSAPENLDDILQTWNDLSRPLIKGKSFEIGRPFGWYLIAWTIYNSAQYRHLPSKLSTESSQWLRQQDIPLTKDGAVKLIDDCIKQTDSMSNFPLKPFFHITRHRWEFEDRCYKGDLDKSVAIALLERIDKVVQLCQSFDQDWMKIDSFGAMCSAINLKIEIAICFNERIQDASKFESLKEEADGNLKMLTEDFERNRSVIPIYDEAWFYSVQSKFCRMIGEESQARHYAKEAACLYRKCGRDWRASEEDKNTGNSNQSTCSAELKTGTQCTSDDIDISMLC